MTDPVFFRDGPERQGPSLSLRRFRVVGVLFFVIAVALAGATVVQAADESPDPTAPPGDVIAEVLEPLFAVEDWSELKTSEWDRFLLDALEVYEDSSESGIPTACRDYAGGVWSYLHLMKAAYTGDRAAYDGAYLLFLNLSTAKYYCNIAA